MSFRIFFRIFPLGFCTIFKPTSPNGSHQQSNAAHALNRLSSPHVATAVAAPKECPRSTDPVQIQPALEPRRIKVRRPRNIVGSGEEAAVEGGGEIERCAHFSYALQKRRKPMRYEVGAGGSLDWIQ